MTETMTAAEAREYLAESEENVVSDCERDKWSMRDGEFWRKYSDGVWRKTTDLISFDSFAPFTPYVRRTKRQLRESETKWTERANAALNEALVWRERALAAEECAEAAEARVKELEAQLNTLALDRDDLAHSLGYAEATIATVTAERDALRAKLQAPIRRPDDYMFES